MSEQDANNFIRTNCSQFLKESRNIPLYRGIDGQPEYFISAPEVDRRPRSTPLEIQNLVDDIFMKKFKWKPRSGGVFTSGNYDIALGYGDPFRIYPVDGYKYIWSPDVRDLFYEFWEFKYRTDKYEKMKKYAPERATEDEIREHMTKMVSTYKNTSLAEGIKSGNEIMIQCEKYLMVLA